MLALRKRIRGPANVVFQKMDSTLGRCALAGNCRRGNGAPLFPRHRRIGTRAVSSLRSERRNIGVLPRFGSAANFALGKLPVPVTAKEGIGLVSIAAIVALAKWEEWVSLVFGLWVATSPWLLGYQATVISSMRANAAIGIAIVLLAAAELAMIHRSPPHVTA